MRHEPPVPLIPFPLRMNAPLKKVFALPALLLLLAGCAQTGPPLPPSLELPKPPGDLRANRKGNSVTLTWGEPVLTTDRQTVRYLGPTLICRTAAGDLNACGNPAAILPPPSTMQALSPKSRKEQPVPQTYTDNLPQAALQGGADAEITYAVEVLNRNARGAGLSNRVHVPAIATLPPPTDLSAALVDDGVALTWTSDSQPLETAGVQHRYRIYRRDESTGKDSIAGEPAIGPVGPMRFTDNIEWEKTYLYRITAVTIITRPESEVQVEGNDSPIVRVVAHDVFPPAVPSGLQAAYSGEGQKPFIDLIWAPVTSADLVGYNVYRSEASGSPVKLNSDLVKSPSYRDSAVTSGKTYTYSVSAVDVRGNESAHSESTSESVP